MKTLSELQYATLKAQIAAKIVQKVFLANSPEYVSDKACELADRILGNCGFEPQPEIVSEQSE